MNRTASIWAGQRPTSQSSDHSVDFVCNQLESDSNFCHLVSDIEYWKTVKPQVLEQWKARKGRLYWLGDPLAVPGSLVDDVISIQNLGRVGFGTNPARGLFHGASTAYFGIQLAFLMGFEEIRIHGLSYSYGPKISRPSAEGEPRLPDALISPTLELVRDLAYPHLLRRDVKLLVSKNSVL